VGDRDPESGRTALHAAVDAPAGPARLAVVRALLAAGADVESTTSDGASAVDIARVAAARDRAGDDAVSRAQDDLVDLLEDAAVAR
jgi:ankyrin repeat protein